MTKNWITYSFSCCMVFVAMLFCACERDNWIFDEVKYKSTNEEINVLLSFEIPKIDKVAVTRAMSELEEHNITDLYVLVFDGDNDNNPNYGKLISKQYFPKDRVNEGKVMRSSGTWHSILEEDATTNSTYGTVMAKALNKPCFIYGIANVKNDESEDSEATNALANTLDNLLTLDSPTVKEGTDQAYSVDNLYDLQANLNTTKLLLGRDNTHLLMSGVYMTRDKYKSKVTVDDNLVDKFSDYQRKYSKEKAGFVDFAYITTNFANTEVVDVKQAVVDGVVKDVKYVDLSKAGVIQLRRLSSHITFKISANSKLFSNFKPESYQVIHVPTSSYLIDQGDETTKISSNDHFTNSKPQTSIIHADGTYQFDFYMYENRKGSRNVSDPTTGLTSDDQTYYLEKYGNSITDTQYNGSDCAKLTGMFYQDAAVEYAAEKDITIADAKSTYDTQIKALAKDNFLYAKRDLQIKDNTGSISWNRPSEQVPEDPDEADEYYLQSSKKFVYVEPNATYVLIKGRLLFNTNSFELTNLLQTGDGDVQSTGNTYKDSYADVTYLVHLGYARNSNLKGERPNITPSGESKRPMTEDEFRLSDFNSLRNTEYTYYVEIQGVNSIYTQVVAKSGDDVRESADLQPGASGFIGITSDNVYNTDAHFNSFVIFLSKEHLTHDGFYFEINTPWSTIKSTDISDESGSDNYNTAITGYKWNSDFTWIKVRRNWDQTKGSNQDNFVRYTSENKGPASARKAMPYYKQQGDLGDIQYESKYHFKDCPLIDLYQLKKELALLYSTGLTILKDGNQYKVFLEAGNLNYYSIVNGEKTGEPVAPPLDGLFYTVYLDEYYYHKPPTGKTWEQPYWHEFVNKPTRYVSFGKSGLSSAHESSLMEPELMILQPSIQSHYATDGGIFVGLGMEHYNETPNPRWKDLVNGNSVDKSGLDKKEGWKNAKKWIVDKTIKWDDYVADSVWLYNNLAMWPSWSSKPVNVETSSTGDGDGDAQYKANAIRLCMNRNRDENGNGKIDLEEMKWYLPSSQQLDVIAMSHFSYYDPLLNYNDYIEGSLDSWGYPRYKLKSTKKNDTGFAVSSFYHYHYVSSDFNILMVEEFTNLKSYNSTGSYTTRPGEMRCVRNLGSTGGTQNTNAQFYYYGDNGPELSPQSVTQDYPGDKPEEIFSYNTQPEGDDGWTNKVFVMTKYLDSRSIRSAKYVNEELPPHFMYSETNRPYKAFQVAKGYVELALNNNNWVTAVDGIKGVNLKDLYDKRPCAQWKDPDEDDDAYGSWRVPSAVELSYMMNYLRGKDPGGKPNEATPVHFFDDGGDAKKNQYFSATSWNWTGSLWARLIGVGGNESPRKIYLSDAYKATFDEDKKTILSLSKNSTWGQPNISIRNDVTSVRLRCVKDVEPPID